jgi:hypothetical protein
VDAIEAIRGDLVLEFFPVIADLRNFVQISSWSDHHLVTQQLLDALPFGRTLSPISFYQYIDYQLPNVVDFARRNLLYWSLSGARHFDNTPAFQITLFSDDTFLWHYYVPAKREEIIQTLLAGDRVRFLSRFLLSQAKIEVEFNEIKLRPNPETGYQLVYSDCKEYTYQWETRRWEVTILNHELAITNPISFTDPVSAPNPIGREDEYENRLAVLLQHTDDLRVDSLYWGDLTYDGDTESTTSSGPPALVEEPLTPPLGPYLPRNFNLCGCGIDVCRCNVRYPGTPPTPPYIELWEPTKSHQPIRGLHYHRH